MKIVISNSKVVLKSAKAWTQHSFEYVNINTNTGIFIVPSEPGSYTRAGSLDFISIAEEGKSVIPTIPSSQQAYVFAYDENQDFIGCGQTDALTSGETVADILSAVGSYAIGATTQDKSTVIANAKYFRLAFGVANYTLTGYGFKVR